MRQLTLYVPDGRGAEALAVAKKHDGVNVAMFPARGAEEPCEIVLLSTPNKNLDALLEELETLGKIHITFAPSDVVALHPPASEAPEQVVDVEPRSPLEVFLAGLQSIGAWGGFAGYAVGAGIIVWVAFFTNTIFLLTASMLIAPFAGPAMNLALGTARGDKQLVLRSTWRYFGSLAITVVTAWLLTILFRQKMATQLMVEQSMLSSASFLLPLTAGAAGALNLCQSERKSLVSGAATGMLVAASLAPPAGLLGMSMALGDWSMASGGLLLLLMQLAGINLSGMAVFRLFGVKTGGVRFERGERWLQVSSLAVSAVALTALLLWQFLPKPEYQRSTVSLHAAEQARDAVNGSGIARLVEVNARFTRADIARQESLLVLVYAQPLPAVENDEAAIRTTLQRQVADQIRARHPQVTPLVHVTLLQP